MVNWLKVEFFVQAEDDEAALIARIISEALSDRRVAHTTIYRHAANAILLEEK